MLHCQPHCGCTTHQLLTELAEVPPVIGHPISKADLNDHRQARRILLVSANHTPTARPAMHNMPFNGFASQCWPGRSLLAVLSLENVLATILYWSSLSSQFPLSRKPPSGCQQTPSCHLSALHKSTSISPYDSFGPGPESILEIQQRWTSAPASTSCSCNCQAAYPYRFWVQPI